MSYYSGGLMLATYLALQLKLPYALIRKKNKLPGKVLTENFADASGKSVTETAIFIKHFIKSKFQI